MIARQGIGVYSSVVVGQGGGGGCHGHERTVERRSVSVSTNQSIKSKIGGGFVFIRFFNLVVLKPGSIRIHSLLNCPKERMECK